MEEIHLERMVQDHEQRIMKLESNYDALQGKMQIIENGQLKIENTLLQESQEQKSLINKQREEQDDLFNTLVSHTLGIKKDNQTNRWQLILSVFGTGGFLFMVFEFLMSKFH